MVAAAPAPYTTTILTAPCSGGLATLRLPATNTVLRLAPRAAFCATDIRGGEKRRRWCLSIGGVLAGAVTGHGVT